MKMVKAFIVTLLCIVAIVIPSFAQTNYSGEHIADFQQSTVINTDGTIDITEKIVYDFGNEQRHGIFRKIPYTKLNKEGKKFKMTFSGISVTDETGKKYSFSQTDESGEISLKIGDANATITGKHTYEIRYRVSGALTYFSDHDELYWNITRNDWDVPIAKTRSIITFPFFVDKKNITLSCYWGEKGSQKTCASAIIGNTALFESVELDKNLGMSVVIGFPKGMVAVLEPRLITDFLKHSSEG